MAQEPTNKKEEPVVDPKAEEGKETPPVKTEDPKQDETRNQEEWDKMKGSNKQLFDSNQILQSELQRLQKAVKETTPGDPATPPAGVKTPPLEVPALPGQTVEAPSADISDFVEVDPKTGDKFINEEKLQKVISRATTRAQEVEKSFDQYVKNQKLLDDRQQTAEAYGAYPQLNPSSDSFDTEFQRQVRSTLLDSMMNPQDYGGTALKYKAAADMISGSIKKEPVLTEEEDLKNKKVEEDKANQKEEGQNRKDQASSTGSAGSSGGNTPASTGDSVQLSELRKRTRVGDMWAVARRLTEVPHSTEVEGESKT